MKVQILSGLRLTMHPDPISGPNRKGWSAKTQFSNILTSKYQVCNIKSMVVFKMIFKFSIVQEFNLMKISSFVILGGVVRY